MEEEFTLVVSSSDPSIDGYPDNAPHLFTVELPQRIQLTGEWLCHLESIQGAFSFPQAEDKKDLPSPINVLGDFVDNTIFCGSQ